MPKIKHWYDTLRDKILSPIDNWIATPFNNLQFILDMLYQKYHDKDDPSSYFDVKSPYHNVNFSANAPLIKGSIFLITVFGIFFSFFIACYRKLRRQEGISHYFFFENLFRLEGDNAIGALGKFSIPSEHLRAAAFFYNPDLPRFVCWIRRIRAYLVGKNAINDLEKYLNAKKIEENKSKKMLLEKMYKEINEKVAAFITKQKKYGDWEAQETSDGNWFIKPSDDYFEDWLRRRRTQQSSRLNSNKADRKNFFLRIFNFLSSLSILDGLSRASFVYWIVYFIFLFFPGVGLAGITVVAWPPIAAAFIFVSGFWATKYFSQKKITSDVESTKQNEIKWLTEAVKHQIFLDSLLKQITTHNLNYNKAKFRERLEENGLSKYKESRLCKEIRESLKNKSDFILVQTIFKGFIIEGCFPIFFISWLLISALGLVLTLNCAVVALITLGLGIVYGVYSAINRYRKDMEALLYLEEKFLKIQEECGDIEIPDISLTECDRLFRRGKVNATSWTVTKQWGNRIFIGFVTFGTGMLFLKLLPLGITMAILKGIIYAGLSVTIIPSFFPMLGVMLAGGIFFAGVLIFLSHNDKKGQKAGRVLDFICNRPYNLDADLVSPSVIVENSNNEGSALSSGARSPLDGSKRAFHLLSYDGNRFPCQPDQSQMAFLNRRNRLRKWSKSELSLEEKKKIWRSNDEIINLNNENQILKRKRSNTLPPNIGNGMRKQEIDSKVIAFLKEFKKTKNTAMFAGQKTNLNGLRNSQDQPDSQKAFLNKKNCLRIWPKVKFSLQEKNKVYKNNGKVIKLNNGKKILKRKRSNTTLPSFGNGVRKKTYSKVKALFQELKQTKNTALALDSQLNESQNSQKARAVFWSC